MVVTVFNHSFRQPTPVFLPGKSHGRRILVGYSAWGHQESDTTERLHFHFFMDCRGKGRHWKCRLGQLMEALGSCWWTWSLPLAHGVFPCGSAGRESTCNAGDLDSIPGLGRSPGEGKGYPLQYSGPENSMDCIVHRVAKSQTRLRGSH